ncbi:MAG: PAS domain S-box protein [Thermodesulfobacteriota bacterium]
MLLAITVYMILFDAWSIGVFLLLLIPIALSLYEIVRRNRLLVVEVNMRRQAEAALAESERRYRELVESANSIILRFDMDGRITFINEYAETFFGYRREELIGRQVVGTIVPESADSGRNFWFMIEDILVRPEKYHQNENENTRKDGRRVWVNWTNRLVKDEAGRPNGILAVGNDVSERKEAQRKRQEAAERYRAIFRYSPTPLSVTTRDQGKFLEVNEALCRMTGYRPDELLGRTVNELNMWEDFADRRKAVAAMREQGELHDFQTRFLRKSGEAFPALLSIFPIQFEDLDCMINMIVDISEREAVERALRASEARLLEAQQIARVGNWHYEVKTGQAYWSKTAAEIYGFSDVDRLPLGWKHEALVHPDDLALVKANIDLAWRTGSPLDFEYRIVLPDQTIRHIHSLARCQMDETGQVLAASGTIQDISDRKKVEEEKVRLESQLRQVQKMEAIGTLAGGIAHDFNNTLTAIIGFTELALLETTEGSSPQNHLKFVLKAGERAKDLVGQILSFSRRTEEERAPVDLQSLVKEALRFIRASLPVTITIKDNYTAEERVVLADPTQIHQLLMNLCTNAAHAMREKGGLLEISLENTEVDENMAGRYIEVKPGSYLRLSVRDTGQGMSREIMDRIFDPFFTTKAPGEGTGLGLAVVHGIVRNHDGAIKVYSEPGHGSVFHIYLPLVEGEAVADRSALALAMPGGSERILFVDDEEMIVVLYQEILEFIGYRVTGCTSSLEALEAFKSGPDNFDLVITDQTMPNLTGLELAKRLLKIRPDVPIILCTGFSHQVSAEMALSRGIKRFLMKPLVVRDLSRVIRAVLDENDKNGRMKARAQDEPNDAEKPGPQPR